MGPLSFCCSAHAMRRFLSSAFFIFFYSIHPFHNFFFLKTSFLSSNKSDASDIFPLFAVVFFFATILVLANPFFIDAHRRGRSGGLVLLPYYRPSQRTIMPSLYSRVGRPQTTLDRVTILTLSSCVASFSSISLPFHTTRNMCPPSTSSLYRFFSRASQRSCFHHHHRIHYRLCCNFNL